VVVVAVVVVVVVAVACKEVAAFKTQMDFPSPALI
jgi:hypothetical protein